MKAKIYGVMVFILAMMILPIYSIYTVSTGAQYVDAAGKQNVYKLNIAAVRETIYDCKFQPLTGSQSKYIAAVVPTIESCALIDKITEGEKTQMIAAMLEGGKPFKIELTDTTENNLIDIFEIPVRYSDKQLAPHLIGYLDSEGNGITGIELAMNDVLTRSGGELSVYYQVDALGRAIAGADRRTVNTFTESDGGVSLTIDSEIQRFAEAQAQKLHKGAVVVTEVPNCEVRAIVSVPTYSQNAIDAATRGEDSPLINRAFSSFSPGSVFKLVIAAKQIEADNYKYDYTCTGSITIDGLEFNCINGMAHGRMNLHTAIQKSCNCYFIDAARRIGPQEILGLAYNFGFGVESEFGRGLYSQAGNLPTAAELEVPRAFANFAFGQGNLLVTPLQINAMMNTIASGGEYTQPKIIGGILSSDMDFYPIESEIIDQKMRVLSEVSVSRLLGYMESAVSYGTAKSGGSDKFISGAKTGTAQTGVMAGEDELLNFWYSGYISDSEGPRYIITVLSEGAVDDEGISAEIFREIGNFLAENYF